jgi:hypothetical protein
MGEIKNAYGILAGKPKRNINTWQTEAYGRGFKVNYT